MINWTFKKFEELTPFELYDIIRLRNEVFVVEQNCVFQDADDKDQGCWHLMGRDETGHLIVYSRIVPPGLAFDEPSIGRVVSSPAARRTGAGRIMMQKAIELTEQLFGNQPIQIGAQLYLRKFYESLGFSIHGEVYLEDGIEHIHMLRP